MVCRSFPAWRWWRNHKRRVVGSNRSTVRRVAGAGVFTKPRRPHGSFACGRAFCRSLGALGRIGSRGFSSVQPPPPCRGKWEAALVWVAECRASHSSFSNGSVLLSSRFRVVGQWRSVFSWCHFVRIGACELLRRTVRFRCRSQVDPLHASVERDHATHVENKATGRSEPSSPRRWVGTAASRQPPCSSVDYRRRRRGRIS